jgi:uncharacterized membrane-anchored protein
VEQQNRDLLKSMNERTRLQLRLQATVEGLSVAAISYYVVGLFGYLVKAAHDAGVLRVEPSYATAAFVPVAVLAIWWVVRRIRRKNIAGSEAGWPGAPETVADGARPPAHSLASRARSPIAAPPRRVRR